MGYNYDTGGAPAVEPLSLAEAKLHLRVDTTADDSLISSLITAARITVENETKRALITQSWIGTFDQFPSAPEDIPVNANLGANYYYETRRFRRGTFWLENPPLQSVTSITYIDINGVQQTLDPSTYQVDTVSRWLYRVQPAYAQSWPASRYQNEAVTIKFKCGYGDTSASVPEPLRQAMRLLIGTLYSCRETLLIGAGNVVNAPADLAVQSLCSPYAIRRFA